MATHQVTQVRKPDGRITDVKTADGTELSVDEVIQRRSEGDTFVTASPAVVAEVVDDGGSLRTVGDDTKANNLDNLPEF